MASFTQAAGSVRWDAWVIAEQKVASMAWPQAPDYVEVVQNLALGVRDPDLRQAVVVNNSAGLPSTRCGSFATVFHLHSPDGSSAWALKCFTRAVSNLQRRYHAVERHLQGHARLPFMVRFAYLNEGILVQGRWYSVLKMDWVEGLRLDEFLDDCLKRDNYQTRLQTLSRMWLRLARMLREAQVGHGDLQHGNVLLVPVPERNAFQLKLRDAREFEVRRKRQTENAAPEPLGVRVPNQCRFAVQ